MKGKDNKKGIWSKFKELKLADKIWLLLGLASLISAFFTFTGRLYFVYSCFAIIISGFIFIYRTINRGNLRFCRGKLIILNYIVLFIITIKAITWTLTFYFLSYPVGEYRRINNYEEKALEETNGFERVTIEYRDGKLGGWFYRSTENENAPLLIFFCGAGECSADSMGSFYEEGNLMSYLPEYNFLCMDYPGYGNSDGRFYEASIKSMALSIYDEAITWDDVNKDKIMVMGYSIGTGPAAYLAKKREVESLILVAAYDKYYHVGDMERSDWWQTVWGYNLHPYDFAEDIKGPVLMISSDTDKTCFYESAKRVEERLEDCKLVKLTDIKHENMLGDESYQVISDFLQ